MNEMELAIVVLNCFNSIDQYGIRIYIYIYNHIYIYIYDLRRGDTKGSCVLCHRGRGGSLSAKADMRPGPFLLTPSLRLVNMDVMR